MSSARASVEGLSPRARGNQDERESFNHPNGSIPACAGEPSRQIRASSFSSVYPRVRGGTTTAQSCTAAFTGLSPRARGNRWAAMRSHRLSRSIPACAGEPPWIRDVNIDRKVYPRVRGGTKLLMTMRGRKSGLSPRARGNLGQDAPRAGHTRSIPACAGEPALPRPCARPYMVYPRVRGGTGESHSVPAATPGLSPRARGNLLMTPGTYRTPRSIPACAGEPGKTGVRCPPHPVYPRVRGGTCIWTEWEGPRNGLSPRARGNHCLWVRYAPATRSIPACAGEPSSSNTDFFDSSVYPRVRGGTLALPA